MNTSLVMPLLCFGAAAFYRLGLGEVLDDLLPGSHGPALFAVLCFVVAAAGFSLQSVITGTLRRAVWAGAASSFGRLVLVAYTAAVFTSTSLLWFAVESAL
jgi:hypothetical protein